ncbi:MAG: hypothetical protein AAF764_11820, partial [Pseudomonadota bacterium]
MIIAACLGGGIALGGGWLLQSFASSDTESFATAEALESTRVTLNDEITTLRQELAAARSEAANGGEAVDTSALESRIAALEERPVPSSNGSATAPVDPAIIERISALETALEEATATLAQVQSAVSSGEAGENAGLASLAQRVTQLDEQVARLADAPAGDEASQEALAALQAALPALRGTVEETSAQLSSRMDVTTSTLEDL